MILYENTKSIKKKSLFTQRSNAYQHLYQVDLLKNVFYG